MQMHSGRGHLLLLLLSEGSATDWGPVRGLCLGGVAGQGASLAGRLPGGLISVRRLLA